MLCSDRDVGGDGCRLAGVVVGKGSLKSWLVSVKNQRGRAYHTGSRNPAR
jgi:hypothetical protein